MEINPNFVLEDCPVCRGNGFVVHEGGGNAQVECADCSAHTVCGIYHRGRENCCRAAGGQPLESGQGDQARRW